MINFSLSTEQKQAALSAAKNGFESAIYSSMVILGLDPDTYDFSQIEDFKDYEEPSTQAIFYNAYKKYQEIENKINSL